MAEPSFDYAAEQRIDSITAADIRQIVRSRRLRDRYVGPGLFEDPAWDMMLDLYARIWSARTYPSPACASRRPSPLPPRSAGSPADRSWPVRASARSVRPSPRVHVAYRKRARRNAPLRRHGAHAGAADHLSEGRVVGGSGSSSASRSLARSVGHAKGASSRKGALSSAGRAARLHRVGRRFEPVSAHHLPDRLSLACCEAAHAVLSAFLVRSDLARWRSPYRWALTDLWRFSCKPVVSQTRTFPLL